MIALSSSCISYHAIFCDILWWMIHMNIMSCFTLVHIWVWHVVHLYHFSLVSMHFVSYCILYHVALDELLLYILCTPLCYL